MCQRLACESRVRPGLFALIDALGFGAETQGGVGCLDEGTQQIVENHLAGLRLVKSISQTRFTPAARQGGGRRPAR